jgi:DNA repair protein RadC
MISETLKQLVREESYKYISENYSSTKDLLHSPLPELERIPGIGKTRAKQLKAIMDLSTELLVPDDKNYHITQPKDAYEYLKFMALQPEENLMVLCLNTKNRVIHSESVSKGSLNASIVHPREVFVSAIKVRAASVIVVHNHPSGNPEPSAEDISITSRLKECGKIIGIELLDHIIIGDGTFVSLKEKGVL